MLATRPTRGAASIGAGLRAWLATGAALAKVGLQERLVYRFNLLVSLLKTVVMVQVFRLLWLAIYAGRPTAVGVGVADAITYSALSMVVMQLFPNDLIFREQHRVRTGDVVFDLSRPVAYGDQLFFGALGRTAGIVLTNSLPAAIVIALSVRLALPPLGWVWLAFALSLGMGILINFLLDYTTALFGFWTTQTGGLANFKYVLAYTLGGWYIPLWVFPPVAKQLVLALPFCGISYTPLALLVGAIQPAEMPAALALQAGWILALLVATRLLYRAVVKKLAIQGG